MVGSFRRCGDAWALPRWLGPPPPRPLPRPWEARFAQFLRRKLVTDPWPETMGLPPDAAAFESPWTHPGSVCTPLPGAKNVRDRAGLPGQKGAMVRKENKDPLDCWDPRTRASKGAKGDQGLEGRPGDQGPKEMMEVCPDLPVEVQHGPSRNPRSTASQTRGLPDGVDGSPGQKGDKGDKGNQGEAGPAGQTGIQGDKGDMGLMGMMGAPGPCMPAIQSAFAAGLTSSYPEPNTPVVFSYVFYNVQGSYDPTTGIYTAPINGTYIFSYHLTVYERVLKVGLFHNFNPVVKTTEPKVLGTTSHSLILHLARGDRVWLQVKDVVTNGMYAGPEASSTFSGFLLHPDSCDLALLRIPIPPIYGTYKWEGLPLPTPPTNDQ
ncbi:inner ear-specific collagen-like protein [Lates japonicus]|uniref:Inner ear-specific collagen-like protein n=1 Tax=Lates japonicus TaxID=270547 RepID=A0AAD3NBU4_LATJO|nr:inner ear-specific collagen-like protein [Lates japonicus]